MPRLIFTAAARADLVSIGDYIERESGSVDTAEDFVGRIVSKCEKIESLSAMMGRSRPELLPGIRSVPFGEYLIFLRYLPTDEQREQVEIVNVLHARRDIEALFKKQRGRRKKN